MTEKTTSGRLVFIEIITETDEDGKKHFRLGRMGRIDLNAPGFIYYNEDPRVSGQPPAGKAQDARRPQ
jgi:hypothetical protein